MGGSQSTISTPSEAAPTAPTAPTAPVPSSTKGTSVLQAHLDAGFFEEADKSLVEQLRSKDQDAIFDGWSPVGSDDDAKRTMMTQLRALDESCPGGGLANYVDRARGHLAAAAAGSNPLEGWTPEVPLGAALDPETPEGRTEQKRLESLGAPELAHCAFVLVAGGLGERLGYSSAKVGLPVTTARGRCYLELYIRTILALQRRSKAPSPLPLAIMVSGDTEAPTRRLLDENDYFGASRDQVTLMKQEKVPALANGAATLAMESAYEVLAKPHGHGDVHALLHTTGLARTWKDAGRKWVVFFQDTNALAFLTLIAVLGVSAEQDFAVNSLTVPRKAKQAIGAITRLRHADGREMTVNVEYNQLDALLRATTLPEGDENDATTGFSPFPGNINQLVVKLEPYVATLEETGGLVPEFVNPKYADAERTTFKKPTRLETMMQDLPKCMGDAKVGFTQVPSWYAFSPLKNSLPEAKAAAAKGAPTACAAQAEADVYGAFTRILTLLGASIETPAVQEFSPGIPVALGPAVVIDPSTALSLSDFEEAFPNPSAVSLSAKSCLLVEGPVSIADLKLDGAMSVEAMSENEPQTLAPEVHESAESGIFFSPTTEGDEVVVIRGYTTEIRDMKTMRL